MTRAISLHDVSKTYTRGIRVVDRFSLDIAPGEFLVLLGPSGCGKSTVLRMIAGLEEITEGELRSTASTPTTCRPPSGGMAMVFQNFALYPSMTSRENIGFPLRIETPGEDPRRTRGRHRPHARHRGPPRPLPQPALRRRAPARRDGPGHLPPPLRLPDGRAAVQPRRQAPQPPARRNRPAHPGVGRHHGLRHPRPGRGHVARRPGRRDARRSPPAGRAPRARSTRCPRTSSSPPSSAPRGSTCCAASSGPRSTAR